MACRARVKLIIQIPCYNEEATLPETLAALPASLEGVDEIETLVVNDGSSDRTLQIAKDIGVDHIVTQVRNRGLARAFMAGLEASLDAGADIVVNTDGDNQYCADDIPVLIAPILTGEADIVIGARPIFNNPNFGILKKLLQQLGSAVVRVFSGTDVRDAPCGFRAISRLAAMQMRVFSGYTYTLETIIQAGHHGLSVKSVPVRVNEQRRPSRLVRNLPSYLWRSCLTILRIFILYRPLPFFSLCSFLIFFPGFLLGLRFLVFFLAGQGDGKIQSLILAALLMTSGAMLFIVAILADLIAANRMLLEDVHWRVAKMRYAQTGDRE